jgi:pre-mRNA-splicing factor ATP-dependent RNA helicase DHX38/PRP16
MVRMVKTKEEALAIKAFSRSSSRIMVPDTPRYAGIGTVSQVTQTPIFHYIKKI